ncbi:anthranilate synthase family protein [Salinactinospora qingdaonensis]|uniref:anthranilate synthase n=1 Tax=Salinactinospora qingdaonensis TaxID=702744 RepID=A0ABP7EXI8_9ACTN
MADRELQPGLDLIERLVGEDPPPFALLNRPESSGADRIEVLLGDVTTTDLIGAIPLPAEEDTVAEGGTPRQDVLVLIPFRQLAERGDPCPDDGTPLLTMRVREQATLDVSTVLPRLPDPAIRLDNAHFDVSDEDYAAIVSRIVADEIGTGEGANFVLKRSFTADITGYSPQSALGFFRRLMRRETGAYWTFIVHTGERTLVGASPERHVSLSGGTAVMNPISGTYRYPPAGPSLSGLLEFLADPKETDELYMVVDEELKTMARVCSAGGHLVGPYLKEMARLAHTEYFIEGRTDRDVREILRETMFAPTVTGSPVESAYRVISRYEPQGRGYYSGVMALLGRGPTGERTMDSAILIRTADIERSGRLRIGVGATLVRHSDPASEVEETRAKTSGLLAALESDEPRALGRHPEVVRALATRNLGLSTFWRESATDRNSPESSLLGLRILVVDAEDAFTAMLGHQLRSLGPAVTVCRYDEPHDFEAYDLVVMGPGPGDPQASESPKIARLRSDLCQLLGGDRPFLAVCLSHQILSSLLGLPVVRKETPNQGLREEIDLFGRREQVGFYNTFAAVAETDTITGPTGRVEVSRNPETGEVYALGGPGFRSAQFHPESVLTSDGVRIIRDMLTDLLPVSALSSP